MDPVEPLENVDQQENQDLLDPKARQVPLEMPAKEVHPERLELQAELVDQVHPDPQDHPVNQDPEEMLDHLEHQVKKKLDLVDTEHLLF